MPVPDKLAHAAKDFQLRHHSDDRPANPNKFSVLLVAPSPAGNLLVYTENANSVGQEPGREKLFQRDFDDISTPMRQATLAILRRYLQLEPPHVEFLDCMPAPFHENLPEPVKGMTYTNTYYAAAMCGVPWDFFITDPKIRRWRPLDELIACAQTFKVKPYTTCLRMVEPLIGKYEAPTAH